VEGYNPYFSGSVPSDPEALARLTGMYDAAGSARAKEIANKYKIDRASLEQQYKIALMESGDRRAAIEATREYQRGQLEQARQEMLQVSIPKVQIDQFLAQANTEIARGELQAKQYMYQGDVAYKQGTLQQARDEMLQMGIPKVLIDQFVAQSNAAYQRGELGLKREEMERLGIPKMLTDRYSAEAQAAYQQATARTGQYGAEAQAAYQQGQLGLTAQQQAQQAVEQQRRYALDVAKYGSELASTPDRYFQAQQFAAMAPRLLGLQAGAGPAGGPTPGINQMGSLLAQATAGLQNAAPDYQLPQFPNAPGAMPAFPTMPGYTDPGGSPFPQFPTMPDYTPPPLGAMPQFPTAQFGPMAPLTTPWGATVPGYPGSPPPAAAAPAAQPLGGIPGMGGPAPGDYMTTNSAGPQMSSQSDLAQQWAQQYGYGGGTDPYNGTDPYGTAAKLGISPQDWAQAQQQTVYTAGGYGGPMQGGGNQSDLAGQWAATYGQPPSPNLSSLAPNEQARYQQLMARRDQLQAAGEGDLGAEDIGELQRYQARISQPRYPTGTGTYGGPSAGARPTYTGGYGAPPAPSTYGANDPRAKQLAQIAKASPPSPFDGLNESDAATLRLMESIYKKGGQAIQGGEMERLSTAQKGFMGSAGRLLGYDPDDLARTYQQYRPSQGAASLAG
jgi:hypothetical protein